MIAGSGDWTGLFGPGAALVLVPLLGAGAALLVRAPRVGGWIAVGVATASFALACCMPALVTPGATLIADRLEAHMALLTALSGLAAAWFSRRDVLREVASGRPLVGWTRRTHALLLALLGFLLLAASSDDIGLGWIGIAAATITGALAVGPSRTKRSIDAAWKGLLVGGAGVALALLGIVFLAVAAGPALGPGEALTWTALTGAAPNLQAPMLNLAFVFLLLGYGVTAGLAPLHAWLLDAQTEGPTPISAVLAGASLNVGLIVLLRLRRLLDAVPGTVPAGPIILALGLVSLLLAGFGLWRRNDVKRFFSLSTVQQNGLAAAAIGLGGPLATYAALLLITLHTLVKAAIVQCVGHAVQRRGGQRFGDLGGLAVSRPMLGLTLGAAILALLGVPPSGLFAARFAILGAAVRDAPLAALPLALGLLVGFGATVTGLVALCLDEPVAERGTPPGWPDLASAWVLLGLVLVGGLAPPAIATEWLRGIAEAMQ